MTAKLSSIEQTFLDLVAFDEVYPHEDKVRQYVLDRLAKLGLPVKQDGMGNIISKIGSGEAELALVGHLDIAAPLNGREVLVEDDRIKTDGRGLLGADDKAAVALMLELAEAVAAGHHLTQPVELIFTVGEESGCLGAAALSLDDITARKAMVLDWLGGIHEVVTQSPAYVAIDITYTGRDAHPAEWHEGKNAGAALAEAVAGLKQGEYQEGITCNVGIMQFGEARNKVPGLATLQAEMRSFDGEAVAEAAEKVSVHFQRVAERLGIAAEVRIDKRSPAYRLNADGALFGDVTRLLSKFGLKPNLQSTYGCFDGNGLANRGLDVVMLGAGYYNPHSPAEYLNRTEFELAFDLLKSL